jgi:hypothetical protein
VVVGWGPGVVRGLGWVEVAGEEVAMGKEVGVGAGEAGQVRVVTVEA